MFSSFIDGAIQSMQQKADWELGAKGKSSDATKVDVFLMDD
jgi:hypothetical protein